MNKEHGLSGPVGQNLISPCAVSKMEVIVAEKRVTFLGNVSLGGQALARVSAGMALVRGCTNSVFLSPE